MRLVLGAGFAAILERHLEAASPADLLAWSLAELSDIDPAIGVRRSGREVELLLDGQVAIRRTAPGLPSPDAAARVGGAAADDLTRFQEVAWSHSQLLRRAGAPRLIAESFEGVFHHLDPFSRYITPEEAQAARERRIGEAGLGLRLAPGRRGAGASIAAISPGGPAARAGLRIGDHVLAIDGQPLRTRDAGVAAGLLEGPAGSEVRLLVLQGRTRKQVRLVRTQPVGTPVTARREDDGILVIRIPGFTAHTERQVAAALLAAMSQEPLRGVVLDLRGNRGGLLSQAASVADIFLGAGEVFRTTGRHVDANRIYVTAGPDLSDGLPVVSLVDGRTASSAELVAAALADRGRAAVVGTDTMGKGTVQVVIPLPDGGELLISWSRLILPSGWPLQGLGVIPGLCTAAGPEATAANLAALQAGNRPMAAMQAAERAFRYPVPAREVARIRAACPPGEVPDSGLVAARALAADPGALQAALPR